MDAAPERAPPSVYPLRRRHPLTPDSNLRALLHTQEPLALLNAQRARHAAALTSFAGRCYNPLGSALFSGQR